MNTVRGVRVCLLMVKVRVSLCIWPQKHEQGILSLSGEKALCQLCGTHRNIWHDRKNKQSLPSDLVTLPQGIT